MDYQSICIISFADYDILEIPPSHGQYRNLSTQDHVLGLQSKDYNMATYQPATEARCQLSVGGTEKEPFYISLFMMDFNPYVAFPDGGRFCFTASGINEFKACTGSMLILRTEEIQMDFNGSNQWVTNFTIGWEGTATKWIREMEIGYIIRLTGKIYCPFNEI